MQRTVSVFQVDAFTTRRFSGNPAGVVLDADSLSDAEMQLIARELNNGDTAFLLAPNADDHDLRVRFFTPRAEAAFVGHATIAAHAVLVHVGRPAATRQKQKSGLVRISAQASGIDSPTITIAQPPPVLQPVPAVAALENALHALGINAADLDPRAPPIVAGAGSTRLLLAVNDAAVLARLVPDLSRLAALSPIIGTPGYFIYTLRPSLPKCDTEARMFCPALGINEDPVSGNAHGMLGAYLWRQGLLPVPGFNGAQGHHMGRAGRVRIDIQSNDKELLGVTISGQAIIVFETHITL
jgi:PhzF family phenazine biosynthesis protein